MLGFIRLNYFLMYNYLKNKILHFKKHLKCTNYRIKDGHVNFSNNHYFCMHIGHIRMNKRWKNSSLHCCIKICRFKICVFLGECDSSRARQCRVQDYHASPGNTIQRVSHNILLLHTTLYKNQRLEQLCI